MAATDHSSAQKTESADKENAPPVDAQGGSTSDTSPAMPLEPESDNLERLIDEELESLHPARPSPTDSSSWDHSSTEWITW